MRLIDADALQKLFNEVSTDLLSKRELAKDAEHIVRACLMTTEMIQDAPTIDAVPVWIPCEERMPSENGYYLVTHSWVLYPNEYEVNIDEYRSGEWVETPTSYEVVAWMPLPKPYDGERKDND